MYRRLAELSNSELERRLIEESEKIMTRDLTVISGVAADNVGQLAPAAEDQTAESERQQHS